MYCWSQSVCFFLEFVEVRVKPAVGLSNSIKCVLPPLKQGDKLNIQTYDSAAVCNEWGQPWCMVANERDRPACPVCSLVLKPAEPDLWQV